MRILKDIAEIVLIGIGALMLTAFIVAPFFWIVWVLT